jgi:hypothetical protein
MSRLWISFFLSFALLGCQTSVEVQYQQPSPLGDWEASARQAKEGFTYVELSTSYIQVAPTDNTKGGTTDKPTIPKPKTTGSDLSSNPSKPAASGTTQSARASGAQAATPSKKGKSTVPGKDSGGVQPSTGAPAAQRPANGAQQGSTQTDTPPATLDPALATTLIDGKSWTAKTIPVPKDSYGMMVRGNTSSFWKTTALSVSRFANSDIASAVSVKAQNLVAARIGQIAGVAANLVAIGATLGVEGVQQVPTKPLLPFSIPVSPTDDSDTLNDGWTYSLTYDSPAPAGTVSFAAFITHVVATKVNYWPTPACRAATLSLYPPGSSVAHVFHVIVSTPDYIRLEPLPIDGKLTLGTVCSASVTGTTSTDPLATLSDEMSTLQQGIDKLKPAKPAASTTKPSTGSPPKKDSGTTNP